MTEHARLAAPQRRDRDDGSEDVSTSFPTDMSGDEHVPQVTEEFVLRVALTHCHRGTEGVGKDGRSSERDVLVSTRFFRSVGAADIQQRCFLRVFLGHPRPNWPLTRGVSSRIPGGTWVAGATWLVAAAAVASSSSATTTTDGGYRLRSSSKGPGGRGRCGSVQVICSGRRKLAEGASWLAAVAASSSASTMAVRTGGRCGCIGK